MTILLPYEHINALSDNTEQAEGSCIQDAAFGKHIMITGSPWQSAEAPSSAIIAVHHCMTELLLALAHIASR